jgi:hypothetical protein
MFKIAVINSTNPQELIMLLYTILKSAEAQLPRLRVRRFKAFAAIVCRAVCHAWLTIFHGAACIDTLTAGAVMAGRVMLYINGRAVIVRKSYVKAHKYRIIGPGLPNFAETIADVKKHLKTLAV